LDTSLLWDFDIFRLEELSVKRYDLIVVVVWMTTQLIADIYEHTHNIVTTHSAQLSYSPHYTQIREPTSDTTLTSGNNKFHIRTNAYALTILIETAPTILYMSIHVTHYRTTRLPILEYYMDNTIHQNTILYLTSLHFIV
jgi:hypothetical protein